MTQRARPVVRVVAAHIAEQAAARFHAFGEFLRQQIELLGGDAQRQQPGVGERDMVADLGRIGRRGAQPGHRGKVVRCEARAAHAEQHHAAMRYRVVAGQDHGLQRGRRIAQPLFPWRPVLWGGEPCQLVGQQGAQHLAELGSLKLGALADGLELLQHRLREANQHATVVVVILRKVGRQPVQALQGAQRQGQGRDRVGPHRPERPADLLPIGVERELGDGPVGIFTVRCFTLQPFDFGEVRVIAQARRGVGEEQAGVEFVVADPAAVPVIVGFDRPGVAHAMTEQRVEQGADVAVDHAHVRFPAAIEADVERQARAAELPCAGKRRLWRHDGIAEVVDDAQAPDRVRKHRLAQLRLAQVLARRLQGVEQAFQALQVGDGLEAGDEAALDRRQHGQVDDTTEFDASDFRAHGVLSRRATRRPVKPYGNAPKAPRHPAD